MCTGVFVCEMERTEEKRISKGFQRIDHCQYTTLSEEIAIKATMSKDGWPRFDLRVTNRVGTMEMVPYLGLQFMSDFREHGIPGLPKKLTRAQIIDIVKDYTLSTGWRFVDGWSDPLSIDGTEQLSTWAKTIIIRAFPELEKDGNHDV